MNEFSYSTIFSNILVILLLYYACIWIILTYDILLEQKNANEDLKQRFWFELNSSLTQYTFFIEIYMYLFHSIIIQITIIENKTFHVDLFCSVLLCCSPSLWQEEFSGNFRKLLYHNGGTAQLSERGVAVTFFPDHKPKKDFTLLCEHSARRQVWRWKINFTPFTGEWQLLPI